MLAALALASAPVAAGTAFYAGMMPPWVVGLAGGAYSKQVDRPLAVVSASLSNIELDLFSGAQDEGLRLALSQIRRQQNADGYSWFVMNGDKVVAEMVVTLTPAEGGSATQVLGIVDMGETEGAPPGLGNERVMEFLFANALDAQLADFAPLGARLSAEDLRRKKQFGKGAMTTARMVADPLAIAREGLRRHEEALEDQREFRESQRIEDQRRAAGVTFEPGKPMVDVSR